MKELYCVRLVMCSEFIDQVQDYFPVWEILQIVSAKDFDEAEELGLVEGNNHEDISDKFWCNGIPSHWIFKGVRDVQKLTDLVIQDLGINEGWFSENKYTFKTMDNVFEFVRGETVLCMIDSLPLDEPDDYRLLNRL
ncbi:MAG: hypothetical protein QM758_17505 [Armatimonas sp.]